MNYKQEEDTAPPPGCCSRLRSELRCSYPLFSLEEQGGRVLDVKGTFAPTLCNSLWASLVVRLALFGLCLAGMIYSIAVAWNPLDGNKVSWVFFLTHWTLTITVLYFVLMTALHLSAIRSKDGEDGGRFLYQPSGPSEGQTVTGKLVRFTWALYAIAMPANIIVVLLYWTLDYEPGVSTIDFHNIFRHAISCALIFIDANVLSTIPLRAKQLIFPWMYSIVYVIWTIINSYAGIGDGEWPNEDEDQKNEDDALYSVIDWKHNPAKASVYAIAIVFVVFPLVYFFTWTFSVVGGGCCKCSGSRRKIVVAKEGVSTDEEEGSGIANVY